MKNKKQISRIEAEDLISRIGVLNSKIQYKQKEMHILFRLTNQQNFFMTYNLNTHSKNYFVVE